MTRSTLLGNNFDSVLRGGVQIPYNSLLYIFIVLSFPAPIPTPTFFFHPHELTAPEGQMNSTFLPSWAVSGPHTAEARLINETQQDMGSLADSYVWNNQREMEIQSVNQPVSHCEASSACCSLCKCGWAPWGPTVVLWRTATVWRATWCWVAMLWGSAAAHCGLRQGFIQ